MYKDVVMEWSEQKRSDDELDDSDDELEMRMLQELNDSTEDASHVREDLRGTRGTTTSATRKTLWAVLTVWDHTRLVTTCWAVTARGLCT